MDNHTKAVSATFLVEGQGRSIGRNENCRWKPSLCGIFRIGFSQRNIPGKFLLFSGRVPVCVGLPDQKAGLWCSCLPRALTPGRERALGSGQPFQCSVESFNISFPILTCKAVSSFYLHETDFAPKQDSIVIITQERSSKFTLCHSHTGHWGHTRFRVQYLLKKNQAGITSRRFPSPQLCFNYLLCIETNPQITQSNSFWFQNLDWYFLFFLKSLLFNSLSISILNVGNLGIEEKIRIIAQRGQLHRYRSQNRIVLFFLDNIFEVQLLRNHESLSADCSLLCYDRGQNENYKMLPGQALPQMVKAGDVAACHVQKFCFREHPE